MGILPFFTFLRSPVYFLIAFLACLLLTHVLLSADRDQFLVFLLIGFWGYAIGSIIAENQHQMITWTLPHFRKRLMVWSIIIGLFSVVAWTTALTYAPLNASWSTILLVNLSLYCLGFAYQVRWESGFNRSMLIQACRVMIFFFFLVLIFSGGEVLALGEQHKSWLALIAFAIAIGAFYLMFNQTTFRRKPFSLIRSLRSDFYPRTWDMWKKDALKMRKASTGVWHLDHIGTGIFNWLRAGQYENSGLNRWGWSFSAFYAALAMVFYCISTMTKLFGIFDQSPYDFETISKMIYHMIFYFPQLDSKIAINISGAAFFGICMSMLLVSFELKRGYIYPLSRTQRMWIHYCGLLVQNISFVAASILVFGVLGILTGIKVGFVSEGDISLRILCVLGWAVVLGPMLQWLQVKYALYEFRRTRRQMRGAVFLILYIILACGIVGFTSLMRIRYPDLSLTFEVPILFVCFIFLQWFLLARLKRYYATQDLI